MAREEESAIRIYVHGLRNAVAEFAGGTAELLIGGMAEAPWVPDGQGSVLLTVVGKDETGKPIDIEIAVPLSQVEDVVQRMRDRAGTLEN